MATYVVGDIHGCFREWISLKSKIEGMDPKAEFILTGDILDKGPHSLEMLKWAMEKIVHGSRYRMVLGNHEAEKIAWLDYVLASGIENAWRDSDIARRMLSADGYEFFVKCREKNYTYEDWSTIFIWLKQLPIFIRGDIKTTSGNLSYIVIHNPKDVTDSKQELIIHGHIPTALKRYGNQKELPGKIHITEKMINVDCGLVYGVAKSKGLYGDLAAIRLEDLQEFYYYNHYK